MSSHNGKVNIYICFALAAASLILIKTAAPAQGEPRAISLAEPADNQLCLACHADPKLHRTVNGKTKHLTVNGKEFKNSVHSGLTCTQCHQDIKTLPHPGGAQP